EGAEDEGQTVALGRELYHRGAVSRFQIITLIVDHDVAVHGKHVSDLQTVAPASIDRDDRVAPTHAGGKSIVESNDSPSYRGRGRMWHVLGDGGRGRRDESISCRNLFLGIDDLNCGGLAAPRHLGCSQEHGFKPQSSLVVRVDQRSTSAIDLPKWRIAAAKTADVGYISGAQVDPILLGSDDPRRSVEAAFFDDQRLREKRLDRLGRNRRYRL